MLPWGAAWTREYKESTQEYGLPENGFRGGGLAKDLRRIRMLQRSDPSPRAPNFVPRLLWSSARLRLFSVLALALPLHVWTGVYCWEEQARPSFPPAPRSAPVSQDDIQPAWKLLERMHPQVRFCGIISQVCLDNAVFHYVSRAFVRARIVERGNAYNEPTCLMWTGLNPNDNKSLACIAGVPVRYQGRFVRE